MIDRSATVGFNADVDQYTQSLTQAIAVTNQYSQAADTMLGKVAKLGSTLSSHLVTKTLALTQANKTATAQAAAYQQKLSQLESTSAALGTKTFPKLEKATKSLATQFPIGIDQAVKQMKTLQESGITNIKQMETLGKSFTKLGAATNSYGPETGRQMVELTRSMGNSLGVVEAMGDSLTTLTKQFGGTASGVLAFSKSIAPIAATVGMNQTQVMALSTAFSRLGEDGFAAGNALNKVMLDLNRSVRDGTPELRQYADVLNKDIGALREQFQSDPTSVLVDFTEAINKQGPSAIRTLESLGLEGVRTVKAITSLSREGNLGEIIAKSSEAYGGGSTSRAAEAAMGGVNDQITKLNETMSQMVAGAGKPFLDLLEGILKRANDVAEAFNKVVNSGFMQSMGKVTQTAGGALGMAGSFGLTAVNTALTIGMARRGIGYVGNRIGDYYRGRNAMIAQNAGVPWVPDAGFDSWSGRMGQRAAERQGLSNTALLVGAMPTWGSAWQQVGRTAWGGAVGAARGARSLATLGALAAGSDMRRSLGMEGLTTEQGTRLKEAAARGSTLARGGDLAGGVKEFGTELRKVTGEMVKTNTAFGSLTKSTAFLAQSTMMMYANVGKTAGKGLWHGLSALAGGPQMATLAMAGAGAYLGYKYNQNQQRGADALAGQGKDAFATFNDFAERAGYATRSISALGDAAAATTKALLGEQNTTQGDVRTLTTRERELASDPGYQSAWQSSGNMERDVRSITLMNPEATPEILSRFVLDAAAQQGATYAEELGGKLGPSLDAFAKNGAVYLQDAFVAADNSRDSGFKGFMKQLVGMESETGIAQKTQIREAVDQRFAKDREIGGTDYAKRQQAQFANEMFNWSNTSAGAGSRSSVMDLLSYITGVDKQQLEAGSKQGTQAMGSYRPGMGYTSSGNASAGTAPSLDSVVAGLTDASGRAKEFADAWAANKSGAPVAKRETTETYKRSVAADELTKRMIGVNSGLAQIMDAGNVLAGENNKAVEDLTVELDQLTSAERAVTEVRRNPGDTQRILTAGVALADEMLKRSGGSTWKAQAALNNQLAGATTPEMRAMLQSAYQQVNLTPQAVFTRATQSPMQAWQNRIAAGASAFVTQLPEQASQEAIANREATISDGIAAFEEYAAAARSMAINVRDTLKSLSRSEDQFNRSQERAKKDHNRSMKWAAEDHQRAEFISKRDYNRQMKIMARDHNITLERAEISHNKQLARATEDYEITKKRSIANFARQQAYAYEDYYRQVAYAQEDYARQVARSEEDYQITVRRAQEDHLLQKRRAEEDYQRSVARAYEDFYRQLERAEKDYRKSMRRAEEDYYLSRARAIEDHDRQLAYQIADNAKAMYSPYERVMHQRVWSTKQLIGNMIQQNKMLAQQMARVDELKSMGLSQNVVDQYGLAETQNAQQLARIYNDIKNNAALIDELNATSTARTGLSTQFTTDEDNVAYRRQEEQFGTSMTRMAEDYAKSIARAAEDYQESISRSWEDFTRSLQRGAEDFFTSMIRSEEDFFNAMRRGLEDHIRNMIRGYEDFTTSMRRSADLFMVTMRRSQEEFAIALQQGEDDWLRSKERTIADYQETTAWLKADYDRAVADAKRAHSLMMGDFDVAYATQMSRQKTAFNVAMTTAQTEFGIQKEAMLGDLTTAMTDVSGKYDDLVISALSWISKLPDEYKGPLATAFGKMTDELDKEIAAWNKRKDPLDLVISVKLKSDGQIYDIPKYLAKPGLADNDSVGGDGEDEGSTKATGSWKDIIFGGRGVPRVTNYFGKPNSRYTLGYHTGADFGMSANTPVYSPVSGTVGRSGWARALGNDIAVSTGDGHYLAFSHLNSRNVVTGQRVKRGELIGKVGSTGTNSSGPHLHLELRDGPNWVAKGSWFADPVSYLNRMALGGIVTRETNAKLGEAGYPEAVIPLNQRGADWLRSTLNQYLPNNEAKAAAVQPYCTHVTITNTNYDQSTRINGPITVVSDSPVDFSKQMRAKARRDRIVQPYGSNR